MFFVFCNEWLDCTGTSLLIVCFYFQKKNMSDTKVVDWFLDHQEEAKAYRVTKIRIPRLGFTMYKDSIQRGAQVRHLHVCAEQLFNGDIEEYRVREPFIGLDLLVLHGDIRFEKITDALVKYKKMVKGKIYLTIDLSMGVGHYVESWFERALVGLYTFCKDQNIRLALTTAQFHPMDMDIHVQFQEEMQQWFG